MTTGPSRGSTMRPRSLIAVLTLGSLVAAAGLFLGPLGRGAAGPLHAAGEGRGAPGQDLLAPASRAGRAVRTTASVSGSGAPRSGEQDRGQGRLEVLLVGRDPLDRLDLRVRAADGALLDRRPVPDDRLALVLPAGRLEVQLVTRDGRVLAQSSVELERDATSNLSLSCPPPLDGPRRVDLAGQLWLGEPLHDHGDLEPGILGRLELLLQPLLDAPAQVRGGAVPRRLRVARMEPLGEGRHAFVLPDLEVGGYEARLRPLGRTWTLQVAPEPGPDPLVLEVGPLARAVVVFEDGAHRPLRPRSVRVLHRARAGPPTDLELPWNDAWQAFDLLTVPGEHLLVVEDPGLGSRRLPVQLEEGWSDLRLPLVESLELRVPLELVGGLRARPAHFEVLGLEGGQVLSKHLEEECGEEPSHTLVLRVDRPGTYVAHFDDGALRSSLRLEAGVGSPGPWVLADPPSPRTERNSSAPPALPDPRR